MQSLLQSHHKICGQVVTAWLQWLAFSWKGGEFGSMLPGNFTAPWTPFMPDFFLPASPKITLRFPRL